MSNYIEKADKDIVGPAAILAWEHSNTMSRAKKKGSATGVRNPSEGELDKMINLNI